MDPSDRGIAPPRFEDDLAYLVLFSEALLDVVPAGVAVLDERLRVRAANGAFARAFGQPGTDLAGRPLFEAKIPEQGGRTLGEVLRDLAVEGGERIQLTVDAPGEWGGRRWDVRAAGWDTQDVRFRRVLLCVSVAEPSEPLFPGAAGAPETAAEDVLDRLFALTASHEALLQRLPLGVCFLDPSLRVRAVSRHLEATFGRAFRPGSPGDLHLFSVFPELRDDDLLELLQKCRETADPIRGVLSVQRADGAPLEIEVEVQPVAGRTGDAAALLLLFHEVRGMFPFSTPKSETPTALPAGPAAILAPGNLSRWPQPPNHRVLLVEQDGWTRMILADTIRDAGESDVTLADSAIEALGRHDLNAFGLVVIGVDSNPDDAVALCRRITAECPRLPVLLVTQRSPLEVDEALVELPAVGLLSSPGTADLAAVFGGLFRESPAGTAETAQPMAAPAAEPEPRTYDVVVLGAAEADVPLLRLLYRVPRVRVRMVFDPDPNAFGLSLSQSLGIPALSGALKLQLESPPDAVVIARPGLDSHLAALDLGQVTRVTRDEIELFLVDPDSFIGADRPHPAPAPPRAEVAAEPVAEPVAEPAAGPAAEAAPEPTPALPAPEPPPALGAQVVDTLPERTAPPADPALPPPTEITRDVDALLGALDLLLDFDRFADRVLDMAIKLSSGTSGSLMVLREDRRELRIAASRGLSELIAQKARQRVGDGVAGRVAESGEPLLLTGSIRDESMGREWERPDIRSSICVPVISEERVIGVICINSDSDLPPFGREELWQVAELGRQVGPALDRSLLLRRMRGRSFELAVRAEMETIATSGDDVLSRLRRIAGRLCDMLSLDTCSIYLSGAKRTHLVMRVSVGISAQTTDAVSVPVGVGAIGWVAKNLRPLVLRSSTEDRESGVVFAALPMRHHTDLVGVLVVESTAGVCFDEERVEILASVAAVIGREVGGLRAHEDSERRVTMLSALSELGVAFGAVREREGLARLLAFTACTVLESDVSSVRLLAPGRAPSSHEPSHFELLSAHGASLPGAGDPLSDLEERIVRETITVRQPCRADLSGEWVQPLLERANVSAALGLPLGSGDDLFGVLVVYRVADAQGTSAFRDEEVEVATRLSGYAAASAQRFATEGGEFDR